MEDLGIGTNIVKTLRRHKSLPIQLLARLEGSDPIQLQPYLDDLQQAGVVVVKGDLVTFSEKTGALVG